MKVLAFVVIVMMFCLMTSGCDDHKESYKGSICPSLVFRKTDRELSELTENAASKSDKASAHDVCMHYCYVMSDEERGYLWMTVSAALGCDADRRALRANFGRDAVSFERLRTFCRDLKLTDKERQLGVQKLVDAVAGALGEVDDSCPLDDFIDAVAKRLRAAEPKEEAKKQ